MLTGIRKRLASSTRAAHAAIERELALLEGNVPLDRYVAYLRSMHAVVSAFEAVAASDAALADAGLWDRQRAKREWLERDLRCFNALAMSPPASAPQGFATRAGWAYVLEGSMLGSRVLYRRLAPRLSLTPSAGGAFLHGYGERGGEMWRSFVDALDAIAFSAEEEKACIAGAMQAFESIGRAFRASVAGADLAFER